MKVLVTGGGTDIPIDDVRYIGNFSSGRFASDIAVALTQQKINTTLLTHKRAIKPHIISANLLDPADTHNHLYGSDLKYYNYEEYKTFDEYYDKCVQLSLSHDIIVSAAAISDYMTHKTNGKLNSQILDIELHQTPKILPIIKQYNPLIKMIGFKLLVNPTLQEKEQQIQKILKYGCEFVVYNDFAKMKQGNHEIELHYPDVYTQPYSYKDKNAFNLVEHIKKL